MLRLIMLAHCAYSNSTHSKATKATQTAHKNKEEHQSTAAGGQYLAARSVMSNLSSALSCNSES